MKEEEFPRNISITDKVNFIYEFKDKVERPVSYEWLCSLEDRVINGIYYDILKKINDENKALLKTNQNLSLDEIIDQIRADNLFKSYQKGEFVEKNPHDYYENGRLLSDVQRMEKRENASRR